RRDVDGTAEFGPTGQFRVVVGVPGLPDEFQPWAELFEEVHHLRGRVDVLADSRIADQAVGDASQVVDHLVRRGCVAGPTLRRRAGHPDTAAGQCGGTAELTGLFDDQRGEAGGL